MEATEEVVAVAAVEEVEAVVEVEVVEVLTLPTWEMVEIQFLATSNAMEEVCKTTVKMEAEVQVSMKKQKLNTLH